MCSHVDHVLVALQHGVERVQVPLSVSSSLLQRLDLFLQAVLPGRHLRLQSLQGGLPGSKGFGFLNKQIFSEIEPPQHLLHSDF